LPGAAHFFFNNGTGDLHLRFSLVPCGSHPTFFENLAGISADSRGRGRVPLLQLVLLFHEHGLELAVLPRPLWRTLALIGAPLARALGYSSAYPEYASGLPTGGGIEGAVTTES
jgi:hypothetical protein